MINGLFPGEIYPTKTVGGCIDIFEDAWPDPQGTIDMVEEQCGIIDSGLFWSRAETINKGTKQNERTNYNLGITSSAIEYNNPVAQNVHNQMNLLLQASTIPYARKHGVHELYHEYYNMLKYSTGQEYKAHADGTTDTGRSVSAIIYLNDNYEGGEIEFVNFNIKIKPKPGMLIVFPSMYPYAHIAHPVISGTKYALVTWIKDRLL
jgi:predicted 2-oxoglutarate/Fe(II)-dependent dioxygenase YbiX